MAMAVLMGSSRTRAAMHAALVLMLLIGLSGCGAARSYERTTDGSTVFLDEADDAARAEARQKIVQSLSRGTGVYALGVGDEVEIFFHTTRKPTARQYVISARDKLRIELLGETDSAQTIQVRPDGQISLPVIGPVRAAGQ